MFSAVDFHATLPNLESLSPFQRPFSRWTRVGRCSLKQRMMEIVVSDNWTTGAISHAKFQSNHHHQQTSIQFFYRPDALPVAQPTVSKHWMEKYHIPWTCIPPSSPGVFQLCLGPLIAPGYLGGGLPCLSSALWCQYPNLSNLELSFEKLVG